MLTTGMGMCRTRILGASEPPFSWDCLLGHFQWLHRLWPAKRHQLRDESQPKHYLLPALARACSSPEKSNGVSNWSVHNFVIHSPSRDTFCHLHWDLVCASIPSRHFLIFFLPQIQRIKPTTYLQCHPDSNNWVIFIHRLPWNETLFKISPFNKSFFLPFLSYSTRHRPFVVLPLMTPEKEGKMD